MNSDGTELKEFERRIDKLHSNKPPMPKGKKKVRHEIPTNKKGINPIPDSADGIKSSANLMSQMNEDLKSKMNLFDEMEVKDDDPEIKERRKKHWQERETL
jgi:hypothetical protein